MSIATRYTLFCDGCYRSGPGAMGGGDNRQQERRNARKAGWKRIPKGSVHDASRMGRGEDLCPSCAAARGVS